MDMKGYTPVLQAGGMGTRLYPITHDEIPKSMVRLNGKALMQWQIEELVRSGFKEIIIIVGHLGEQIKEYFKDGSRFGVRISYISEDRQLGSAGALFYLKDKLRTESFILILGDVMFSMDWERLAEFHEAHGGLATLTAHPNSHPHDSDLLLMDSNGVVSGIALKGNERTYWYSNCVNAGIYILSQKLLNDMTVPKKLDLEKDVLMPLFAGGEIYAYRTPEYIKDVGTPERFRQACMEQAAGIWDSKCLRKKQKCIFLDRDGTVNKYKGLIADEELFELEEGVAEAVRRINESGYLAIVVTNQPVVARGMCTEETVRRIHMKMETLLGKHGAYLDDIVFCPHHPDRGYPEENPVYKIKCRCRKPDVGMIELMAEKYNIDLHNSWMVGDSTVDMQTAKNAGLRSVLLNTGQAGRDGRYDVSADEFADSLMQAVDIILGKKR